MQVAAGLGLAIALGAGGGATAWAQAGGGGASGTTPSCADATKFPNPLIITGSSAFEPTASYFAVRAAAMNPPMTIIYNGPGSCAGVANLEQGLALTKTGNVYQTMDANGKPVKSTCQIDATTLHGDMAVSDVFYASCGTGHAIPADMKDIQGPVQAMLPVVASTNPVTAIDAEQAAGIWGCGAASAVGTFTDDTSNGGLSTAASPGVGIQQRTKDSGTQILMATNIGVDPAAMKGQMNQGGGDLLKSMAAGAASEPMQVIGFIAADAYKGALATTPPSPIKSLAFQGLGQSKAYYADSTATAQDRRNVRDGHYVIAGPEHMIVKLVNGAPAANVQKFIDWINGSAQIDPTNDKAWIDLEATAGTIPQCAMTVTHTSDGGPMAHYTPCKPCGCYFELKATGTVPTSCVACSAAAPCAGGKTCSYGYCE